MIDIVILELLVHDIQQMVRVVVRLPSTALLEDEKEIIIVVLQPRHSCFILQTRNRSNSSITTIFQFLEARIIMVLVKYELASMYFFEPSTAV